MLGMDNILLAVVASEMTYTVSGGALNSTQSNCRQDIGLSQ